MLVKGYKVLGAPRSAGFAEERRVTAVLECLQRYGQRLDSEIAKELRLPLAAVRQQLTELAATGEVIICNLTRFEKGQRIDAWQCRVSGYFPPIARGRKAKPPT